MQITSKAGIGTGKCIEFQNQKRFSSVLTPLLVEQRVVRVHLLPALAAGRRLDRVRTGKCRRRRRCQRFFLRFLFAVPQQFLTSQAG